MSKHVVVLLGGEANERPVSLNSGQACARGLEAAGYRVSTLDPSGEPGDWITALIALKPDVVFNALHGPFGEDGKVQGLLEALQIPYTHSGTLASAVAMDKIMSKALFKRVGLTVVEDKPVTVAELAAGDPLPRPYVVKPVDEGSSVGVFIVDEGTALDLEPLKAYDRLMAEEFVPGRELTCAAFNGTASVVTELNPNAAFYNFEAKYTGGITEHIIPADLPEDITQQALRDTQTAYHALGCRGVARADFRYDASRPAGKQLVILEINTQPGMTELSLVPEQAAYMDQSFPDLVAAMVEDASCKR